MSTQTSPTGSYHLCIGQPGQYTNYLAITADSLAHAQAAAQSLATLIQQTITLEALEVIKVSGTALDSYAPSGQGGTVSAPTGVAWSSR